MHNRRKNFGHTEQLWIYYNSFNQFILIIIESKMKIQIVFITKAHKRYCTLMIALERNVICIIKKLDYMLRLIIH